MLEDVEPTCDAPECGRPLAPTDPQLVYRSALGERRAYECVCGAVTITVSATPADDRPRRG